MANSIASHPGTYVYPAGPVLPTTTVAEPTVFLDRDGVINDNRAEHVLTWQQFKFAEGSLEALRLLRKAGYRVIVITNQAAIERGLVRAADVEQLHSGVNAYIERAGGRIDAFLYCPHRPEVGCACRKPQPGLLFQAAAQYNIRLAETWFIGDYLTDVQSALAAGCKPMLVLTGRGRDAIAHLRRDHPDVMAHLPIKRDLLSAVRFILAANS